MNSRCSKMSCRRSGQLSKGPYHPARLFASLSLAVPSSPLACTIVLLFCFSYPLARGWDLARGSRGCFGGAWGNPSLGPAAANCGAIGSSSAYRPVASRRRLLSISFLFGRRQRRLGRPWRVLCQALVLTRSIMLSREYTQPDLLQGYKRALANLTRPT